MKIRHYDFYPDDWLAGTVELDAAERGIFITACALIYARGGPIKPELLRAACPGDLRLYNRCLSTLIAKGKITLSRGYLSNKRCLSEMQRAANRSLIGAQNVAKRWGKSRNNNDIADTTVLPRGNAYKRQTSNDKRQEDSVAKATAASAAHDPVKELWDRAVGLLGDKPASRSLVGKMRKEHGDLAVMDAILACEAEGPSDPVAYLRACLHGKGKGNGRQSPAEKLYAGFAQAAGYCGADRPPDEPLLDGGRSAGYSPRAGRRLDR